MHTGVGDGPTVAVSVGWPIGVGDGTVVAVGMVVLVGAGPADVLVGIGGSAVPTTATFTRIVRALSEIISKPFKSKKAMIGA